MNVKDEKYNADTIGKNVLENPAWLERAILAVERRGLWHNEDDAKSGSYMGNWIRQQLRKKVKIGSCLTGDIWQGRARYLMQQYTQELMEIAYEKAVADAARCAEWAEKAQKRANELKKELRKLKKLAKTSSE